MQEEVLEVSQFRLVKNNAILQNRQVFNHFIMLPSPCTTNHILTNIGMIFLQEGNLNVSTLGLIQTCVAIAEANHMTQEKIHSFALKWLQKYEDDNTPRRLLEEDFAPDCFDLGFEMDCGNSFEERYSFEAFRNPDVFSKVVASIDDPMFLGAAIFSKWRGITHWWEQDLFEHQNRAWFITAFKRLAEISE